MRARLLTGFLAALALTLGMLIPTVGASAAASLFTGKDVKDSSLTSADLKDKTVQEKDLHPSLVKKYG